MSQDTPTSYRRRSTWMATIGACLVLLVAPAGSSFVRAQETALIQTEVLGRPTDHSVTITIVARDAVEAYVECGVAPGRYTIATPISPAAPGAPAWISLDGLAPNTAYVYRLRYRIVGASAFDSLAERRVVTQRSPGTPFTFTVQADPHLDRESDTAVFAACLTAQMAGHPDFMVDLGDNFMSEKLTQPVSRDSVVWRHLLLRSWYSRICHSTPLFLVLGNHEGEALYDARPDSSNVPVWAAVARTRYFANPEPDGFYTGDTTSTRFVGKRASYYAWQWGDALFVVLDPYWFTTTKPTNRDLNTNWNWTLGREQYDWLRQTLSSSNARFRFVFIHHLVGGIESGRGGVEAAGRFEWGGRNQDGTDGFSVHRPGWYKPIHDLLVEHHVAIVFHGHDHFYARQELDGVIYQLVPQPSIPQFNTAPKAAEYGYLNGDFLPNAGALRVSVSPTRTLVEYVRAYKPSDEKNGRRNGDVSASYAIDVPADAATGETASGTWSQGAAVPNPTQGPVVLSMVLARTSACSLSVIDNAGRTVCTLLPREVRPEGDIRVTWDGRDSDGCLVPSGVYHYRLDSDRPPAVQGTFFVVR